MDLAGALNGGKLAMGDPAAVPAGKYGKAALEKLGVWDSVSGKRRARPRTCGRRLRSCRAARRRSASSTRPTPAADPGVKIVGMFPEDSHPPIIYPVALIAASDNPDAAAFLEYLHSDAAKAAFEKQGFTVLK